MRLKNNKKIAVVIIASALFFMFLILNVVLAESTTHEINNFDELLEVARLSREKGHQEDTFILKKDIKITEEDQEKLNNSDFKYISFGSSEYPFCGVFDGQGHYISNLTYESTLDPLYDTGLFSYTGNGAVIKNLTITNADIQSDYRGGIIAGYSEGTIFENILVKDSHLFVAATNNVISLITDGGIRGGSIVGEANNCVLYNCESNGTTINTNNTAGVAALSGKGLFLGGLVGTAISTEVEYSRVIDGKVKNYYDVAVGALGGNTLYVGGIIGQMKDGSKVIDSFSTAELDYYCATYVSVGAGNTGNIGGITGAMYGEKNEILRSHYAGKTTSKQYNAVLVIPVIQNNVNISGITNVYEGGSVVNTYFKPSINPDVNMKVLGNTTTTSSYGPLNDERYVDKDYWQTQNYDFYGNIKRQTEYNDKHYNKWIMDYEKGIPIHGNSVSATLDFENAGKVTISSTELVSTEVSTKMPYSFAVQGLKPSEYDATIKASVNDGYRFVSWYKVPNVVAWTLEKDHIYFDEIFEEYTAISTEKDLNNIPVDDNDLFIAYYQAKVKFYDIEGNEIQTNWYDYGDDIPNIIADNKLKSENAKLIGWTTTKSDEAGGGYSSITAPELNKLKNSRSFYETGESITKAMNLYPVYVDSISNINTVFEGNELDSVDDVSQRDGVGYTVVKLDENGTVNISALGYGENGNFADGYRFLGWYNEEGERISNLPSFKVDDIDLTQKHTFVAKLEYRVDYYGATTKFYGSSDFNGNPFKDPFASVWYVYGETFKDLSGTVVVDQGDTFDGWYLGVPGVPHDDSDYGSCNAISNTKKINESFVAHAHVTGSSNYEIYITSDFPGSGKLSYKNLPSGIDFKVSMTEISSGYNFLFWACGRDNGNRQETTTNPVDFDSGTVFYTGADYGYEAHLDANVTFYNKQSEPTTVTRRYKELIFSDNAITHQYTWPIAGGNININTTNVEKGIHTSKAFAYNLRAENMQIDGYKFIGWIDKNTVTAKEWDYIYGTSGESFAVGSDPYTSKTIDIAIPYLLSQDAICTKPTEIYPVYVKYNVVTTVNVYYDNQSSNINVPSNPTYTIKDGDELGIVTLIPNTNTYVIGTSGEKYVLTSMVRVYEDGSEEEISLSDDGKYTYDIKAGMTYTFMAKYEPVVLIYHLNDTDDEIVLRTRGEVVGTSPMPNYNIADLSKNYIFMGWTLTEPEDKGYHKYDSLDELDDLNINLIKNSTLVNHAMELWPVYIKMQIEVVSNIEDYLNTNNIELKSVRYISRPDINKTQLNAKDEGLGRYQFVGWYKNYQDIQNKGELVTNNTTFILEDKESVENTLYTAVYRKTYNVNYYNKKGEIIYTAEVYQDENRSFVEETVDPDGKNITVPVDGVAYEEINKQLNKNELFQNWQWVKTESIIVQWEDFYNKNITQDMDLYPIIRKITVKDSTGNEIDTIGTGSKQPDVIVALDKDRAYMCFYAEYNQPSILIHIEDNLYKDSVTYDTAFVENKEVRIYTSNDVSEDSIITDYTDLNGNLTVKLYGEITITRNLSTENKEDIFIFEILDKDNNIVKEILLSEGESEKIKIPYGVYKIIQKNDWAWRYSKDIEEDFTINNNSFKLNIEFDEKRGITKWFDSMTYIDNQYR